MAIKGKGTYFNLIRCRDDAEWLAQRRRGVGGSDVAAIMGLSKYKGAYQLWLEKTGRAEPEDISGRDAVHFGTVLEPVIGREFAERNPLLLVRRVNAMCRSVSRPWAQASLDYEVYDPEFGEAGDWGVLEIKTAGARMADDWADGVPLYYLTQVTHYLSVTARPFCDVAVLIGGQEYRQYRILRDDEDIAAVEKHVDDFWRLVESDTPPTITGGQGEAQALLARHPEATREVLPCFAEDVPELAAWLAAREARDEADKALSLATNRLKERIGDDAGFETELGTVKWLRGEAKTIDTKALRRDLPEIAEEYTEVKPRDMGLRFTKRRD